MSEAEQTWSGEVVVVPEAGATTTPAAEVELPDGATPDPDDPAYWPVGSYVEDDGERFRVAEDVGFWPLAEFAKIAHQGADSETMEGIVAIFDLCRDLIHERDFRRFGEHCSMRKYKGEKVLDLVSEAMAVVTATPTVSPSASPGGAASTSPSLNGTSTPRGSSLPTGVVPLEEIPEADRERYMAALSPRDRRRAMGIVPVGQDG
jgi:hypothetical protein